MNAQHLCYDIVCCSFSQQWQLITHLLKIVPGKLGTLCELGLFDLCQNKPVDNSAACPVASLNKHLGFNKMQMAQLALPSDVC